jgi:DNA-binding beta-propeller fold protein YncE
MQISIGTSLALPRLIAVADSGGGDVTWTNPDLADAFYEYVSFSVASQELSPNSLWIKDDGLKMYVIGPNQDSVVEYALSTAWDITTASHTASTSVSAQETTPHGFFFKSDGTKMYLTGSNGDDVNEYDLTTAWDSTTLSHVRVQSVSSQDTGPQDVWFNTDGTKMFIVGYTGKDVNEYSLSTAWDVSTISYTTNFSVSSQADGPRGMFMNPDGTKMYIFDNTSDEVHEYDLTTGFDLSTASYNDVQFDVGTQDANPFGGFFKNDGSKMYIIGGTNDKVFQYSTVDLGWTNPYLSNASYDSKSLDTSTEDTVPRNIAFNTDGTKLFMVGPVSDSVHEYDLSTAWDVSTGTINQSESLATEDSVTIGLFFKPDGTKMYMGGATNDKIYEYDLSTAFDISTLSLNQSQSISAQQGAISGLFFNSAGTKLIVSGTDSVQLDEYTLSTPWDISTETHNRSATLSEMTYAMSVQLSPKGDKLWVVANIPDEVYEYNLTTPFDLSTIAYSNNKFDIGTQAANGLGLAFKTDGSKMYIANSTTSEIFQYSTVAPTWSNPDIANASYDSVSVSVLTETTASSDLFFKPDGTKVYITDNGPDEINEYNLTTAWDLSTLSYVQNFSIASKDTSIAGTFFKPDGTKMYVVGIIGDKVYEYDLSTGWDISTASFNQQFSVSSEELAPRAIYFKPDGTKMFIAGQTGDEINEYSLSTAWDVSTASASQVASVSSEETSPQGLFMSPNGDRLYIVGYDGDAVFQYSLTTAWDISTMSYDSISFSVSSQETLPTGVAFKPDGSKMYITGVATDKIYQYST